MRKRFSQFLDPMSAFEKGPWPVGLCYPLDDACKKLGVTDNLCGKCEADGKGWKLTNMEVQKYTYGLVTACAGGPALGWQVLR